MINKEELIKRAWQARENAYAPYSRFMVGAAVLGINDKIYTGCNIENASYGMTVCGERVAIFNMVADGCKKFKALAVVGGSNEDGGPCLACRQVMTEFMENLEVPVMDVGPDGIVYEHTMRELCPFPFTAFDENEDYHN